MTLFSKVTQGAGATTAAVANKASLTSITLPQSARMITRVWATAASVGTFGAAETVSGYVILESEDCNIEPFQFPIQPIGGYVTLGGGGVADAVKWVVNCPTVGGAVIDVSQVADDATGGAEVQVVVEFSDGGSPFGGGQIHMKAGEPAAAAGTADDGAVSLDQIEITASRLLGVAIYGLQATLTADCSFVATWVVSSDDFAVAGPFEGTINPHAGGDANTAGNVTELMVQETDRSFKVPNAKQKVDCVATCRDAMAGNGHYNWALIYQ